MALTINTPGSITAGQATAIDVTGNSGQVSWTSSMGASISPNPSNDAGGSSAANYTAPSAGTDTLTATDDSGASTSATVTVVAAGGGGGGGGGAWLTNTSVVQAAGAMNSVADFTSTAACTPVMTFQTEWNKAGGPALPVDGGYGPATAAANAQVAAANGGGGVPAGLTSGWPNCGGGVTPPPVPVPPPPGPIVPASGLPRWLWILLGAIVLGGIATVIYVVRKRKGKGGAKKHGAHESKRRRRRRHKR